MIAEPIRMQAAIDLETDVPTPVCILNPEADPVSLSTAAAGRADHLQSVADALLSMRADGSLIEPGEVVGILMPVIRDLAIITTELDRVLRRQRKEAAPDV